MACCEARSAPTGHQTKLAAFGTAPLPSDTYPELGPCPPEGLQPTLNVLTLVAMLAMGDLRLGSGWGLRDWREPPPPLVCLPAIWRPANDADRLVCKGGGTRPTAQNRVAACMRAQVLAPETETKVGRHLIVPWSG